MKKPTVNNVIEYLSLTLIVSYFFIHNIFLVLIGITFSLYLTNINFFNSLIRYINKNFFIKKQSKDLNKNDTAVVDDSINIKSAKEDSKLTLVETIEEFGFIPSVDKNDEIEAA
ncbi:hypothetical protein [Prochlorococcus sp. MIT 0916]|uniref:hypothetical protein n=1 Tax=Prochlorococcus sp. MIT 0916 TaxID=3082521 RepID=UPI0039B47911